MKWRLLNTGKKDAYYNMALDEAVMQTHREGIVPPTVRFYEWSPPGLSFGYFQRISRKIDKEKCRQKNIDPVRRLTGGRTILHDDELTYSIVLREDTEFLPESIVNSYKLISRGIVRALGSLGVEAEMMEVKEGQKSPGGFSAACFDAPSRCEVVVEGKKLVGSAQTRREGVILQHGSIPFRIDIDLLYDLFSYSDPETRERIKEKFSRKAIDINSVAKKEIDICALQEALAREWENEFAITLEPGELHPREQELIVKLKETRYQTEEWNEKY
ncbi:MAG: lipoate--protein ligase family protein [Halanaerobiaceae bacterium]